MTRPEGAIKVGAEKIQEDPVFREILIRIAGEHGYEVASALVNNELTDEELAKRTGIRLNLVRKILYDLYDNRVVGYRRIRDESSGWYIYYWRIEPERAMEFFNNNKRLLLQKLEERLERERNAMYFSCSNSCPKLPFEQAAENDFRCPRCGGQMVHFDNSDVIRALERQIESLRQRFMGS
jgi:transcription initiation factor TFIIE subunit alpha